MTSAAGQWDVSFSQRLGRASGARGKDGVGEVLAAGPPAAPAGGAVSRRSWSCDCPQDAEFLKSGQETVYIMQP